MTSPGMPRLTPRDALLIVDVQRDFCAGGALAVPEGDDVVPVLNAWIDEATRAGALVVATRDFHPPEHVSFHPREGPWPPHCVQDSEGAELHPDLRLPSDAPLLPKGQDPDRDAYSAFDGTPLATLLKERAIERVFVGGLAQDVCVRATVLDALRLGYETHLIVSATRPVDPTQGERALDEMRSQGAVMEP
jgi:nicotinamidase/pyrazinamidase